MKSKLKVLSDSEVDRIIRMAWEDRTSFERIERLTGLAEGDVIVLMRRELKPRSFKLWRARVSGRTTKHRRRFKEDISHKGSFE
ncbi:MAG: TIGR03643 family protein [Lentimonas sp.]